MTEKNTKWDRLKNWFSTKEERSSPKKVPVYLIIILIFGVLLMIIGTIGKEGNKPSNDQWIEEEKEKGDIIATKAKPKETNDLTETEKVIQERLEKMLENISGVSRTEVMVNLQGTEEKVYEKDTIFRQQTTKEEEREGGTREVEDGSKEEKVVIVRQGDKEEPLLLHTRKPEARGVLVVAEGVENLKVKEWVVEAVTRALDVPPHKVSVLPREREEGD